MNYYEILNVPEDASLDEITLAKDKLKFGSTEERAPFSAWESIDEAYKILSNMDSRKAYDLEINNIKEDNTINNISGQFSNEAFEFDRNAQNIELTNSSLKSSLNTSSEKNFNIKSEIKNNLMFETQEDEDIKYFKTYSKNIEKEIDKLVQKSHNNDRLNLLRLRYVNQINMLEKILEMRKNFVDVANNQIIVSIENTLYIIRERLPIITEKIDKYNEQHEISYLIEQI